MEVRSLEVVDGDRQRPAQVRFGLLDGRFHVEVELDDGRTFAADHELLFSALLEVRRSLEPLGMTLLCQGARRDIWPTGIPVDRGTRTEASLHVFGLPPSAEQFVDIFDPADAADVGAIAEQKAHREGWLAERGLPHGVLTADGSGSSRRSHLGKPALHWVDAWLLACLIDWRWRWSRPMKLSDLIDAGDRLFRGQPTFDDVSYSLPRLIAWGYLVAKRDIKGDLRLKATKAAFELKAQSKDKSDSWSKVAKALGIPPGPPDAEEDDRSLGRFPDLDWSEFRAARDMVNRHVTSSYLVKPPKTEPD
jgi:hypothetical protein